MLNLGATIKNVSVRVTMLQENRTNRLENQIASVRMFVHSMSKEMSKMNLVQWIWNSRQLSKVIMILEFQGCQKLKLHVLLMKSLYQREIGVEAKNQRRNKRNHRCNKRQQVIIRKAVTMRPCKAKQVLKSKRLNKMSL